MKIAIDGPSGAGKSSVAKALAHELGIIYVDTGALYRTIGYYVKCRGVSMQDKAGIIACLPDIRLSLEYNNGTQRVILNGEDPGDAIRQPDISMYASAVSAIPEVRSFLLNTQRDIARKHSVVMDGRDIGTVILPDAEVKVFLTAPLEERARRRYDELRAKGVEVSFDDVLIQMKERDAQDAERDIAPAVAAPDAVVLDNSGFTVDESVEAVKAIINSKKRERL